MNALAKVIGWTMAICFGVPIGILLVLAILRAIGVMLGA